MRQPSNGNGDVGPDDGVPPRPTEEHWTGLTEKLERAEVTATDFQLPVAATPFEPPPATAPRPSTPQSRWSGNVQPPQIRAPAPPPPPLPSNAPAQHPEPWPSRVSSPPPLPARASVPPPQPWWSGPSRPPPTPASTAAAIPSPPSRQSVPPPNPIADARKANAASLSTPTRPPAPEREPARPTPRPALQLLWFDGASVPAMRRKWSRLLEQLDSEPPSGGHDEAFPQVDVDVQDEDDRRDTFELLSLGMSHDAEHVPAALRAGRHESGRFVPPLELFHGTLAFSFDELEELKATVTMASPYAAADKRLRGFVEEARIFLDNRNMRSSPEWTRAHTSRIDEALARHDAISMSTLSKQRQRALLEQRCYRTCKLFAAEQLHARLLPAKDGSPAVPAYVPAELANKLPMFEQLRCKLVAEVHPRSSQFEDHPGALRVVALGYLWD